MEATELAPGDVIEVATGDGFPADCRHVEWMEVLVNKAPLTRKSGEVRKVLVVADLDEPFSKNMCFMSTSVTRKGQNHQRRDGHTGGPDRVPAQGREEEGKQIDTIADGAEQAPLWYQFDHGVTLEFLVLSRLVVMTDFCFCCVLVLRCPYSSLSVLVTKAWKFEKNVSNAWHCTCCVVFLVLKHFTR